MNVKFLSQILRSLMMLTIFIAPKAHAWSNLIVIEPYFGMAQALEGEQELIFPTGDPGGTEVSYLQSLAGLRLSYAVDGLSIGLDGNHYFSQEITSKENKPGNFTWDDNTIANEKYNATRTHAGVNIGYRQNVLLWGSYYPLAQLEVQSTSNSQIFHSGDKLSGTGYGGGIGYTINPHFVISAEYRHFEYKHDKTTAHDDDGTKYNLIVNEALVVISFPIAF